MLATEADELQPARLAACLDALLEASAQATKRRRTRRARGTADAAAPPPTAVRTRGEAKPAPKGKRSPIARPPLDLAHVDRDGYLARRDALLAFDAQPLPKTSHALDHDRRRAMEVIAWGSVHEREDPALRQAARLSAQCAAALVELGTGARDDVRFPYGARTATLAGTGAAANPHTWADGWYAALIGRDEASLARLTAHPETAFAPRVDAFVGHWRAALEAFRVEPASALAAIDKAIELGQSPHVRYQHLPTMLALRAPLFPMLRALALHDAEGFQQALVAALVAHRRYFGTPNNRLDPVGMVATGPMALACVAHDAGLDFTADTEYLLPALIEDRLR